MLVKLFSRINSIKVKLLLTMLALFISFMSFTIYLWYTSSSSDAEGYAANYNNSMISVSNNNLESTIKEIDKIVALLSYDTGNYNSALIFNYLSHYNELDPKDLVNNERSIENYLINLASFQKYLTGLTISDFQGHTITYGLTMPYNTMKTQAWFTNITASNGEEVIIPPHYNDLYSTSTSEKGKVISILKPVMNGKVAVGFVMADINNEIFNDFFNVNVENKGNIFIVDRSTNQFVLNLRQGELPLSEAEIGILAPHFTENNGNFYADIAHKKTFVIYHTSAFTKWTTIVLIAKDRLLENSSTTRNKVLLISLIFCALAIVIIFLISSLLTKNLLKLRKALRDIDKDNLDVSIRIDSKDEIGQLYYQFNSMTKRIKNLISDIKITERQKSKAEIKTLQAQINPHFLHNTLNTIKLLSILQGSDNIRIVSESLSELMYINMDSRSFITIADEVQYLQNYLNIQEYRYSDKFTTNFIIEDGIENYMIPKLLLQPVVENALLHGISPLRGKGVLLIKIYKSDQRLNMRVQDNGVGMTEAEISHILAKDNNTKHIGIANVNNRIKMTFGEPYGLTILSQKNLYTYVEISIPILTEENTKSYA